MIPTPQADIKSPIDMETRKRSRLSDTAEVERGDFNRGMTELQALHLFHGPGPSTNNIEYSCELQNGEPQ